MQYQQQQQQQQLTPKQKLENDWLKEVNGWYPDRRTRTLYLPPLWFNRVPYDVVDVGGQAVHKIVPSSGVNSMAGNLLTHMQHSDLVDDETIQGFLERFGSVADSHGEVMMVISGLKFDNYLSSHRGLFPTPKSMSDPRYHEGDFDVLIIHKTLGLITCEMKAVGQHDFKSMTVLKRVEKAVRQLEKEAAVLRHLVSDTAEPDVHVTKTLLLPNITSCQLQDVLDKNTTLLQDLISCLGARDVKHAISLCLCKDESPDTTDVWWNELKKHAGEDPHMSDQLYDQLLARFCGPDTKVYIPTATALSGKVIRTQAEAVAETGDRVSFLALYQQQLDLLNLPCTSQLPDRMYIFGPAGTGKTVVLVLRGLMWLHHGQKQHLEVVSVWKESLAVSIHIEHELRSAVTSSAPASFLERFSYDFVANPQDVQRAVKDLKKRAKDTDGHLHLIVDEMSRAVSKRFTQLITELDKTVGHVSVWCASLHRPDHLPADMQTEIFTEPLRCTPEVEMSVRRSFFMGDAMNCPTPDYSDRTAPPPTKGPPLIERFGQHTGVPGHPLGFPENCTPCGDKLTSRLKQFTSANGPERLEWRDMLILCDSPTDDCAMVQAMRKGNIPVKVVTSTAGEEELKNMALRTYNEVVFTDLSTAAGLERKVVTGMEQNVVTYIYQVIANAVAAPRKLLQVLFVLILLILFTPYDMIRRLILVYAVSCGLVLASITMCVYFDLAKEKCRGYQWLRPLFAFGTIGPGFLFILVMWLITNLLLDDLSRVLLVNVMFSVFSAATSSVMMYGTGFAASGMLVAMAFTYSVKNVLIPVSILHVLGSSLKGMLGIKVFRISGMVVEAVLCIMAGTLSGGLAGRYFYEGTWTINIKQSVLFGLGISIPSIAFLFFTSNDVVQGLEKHAECMMRTDNELGGICELASKDDTDPVYLILSDSVVIRAVTVMLCVHGGLVGRLVEDLYKVRTNSERVKVISVLMVVMVTCFELLWTWRIVHTVEAAFTGITATDVLCVAVTGYATSVALGMTCGWAVHRQGCYPNYAKSRSSSLLMWIGEPQYSLMLAYFWLPTIFFYVAVTLLDCVMFQIK